MLLYLLTFLAGLACLSVLIFLAVLLAQGRRDLNPQPPVLETGALPIEPRPFGPAVDLFQFVMPFWACRNKPKICAVCQVYGNF